MKQKFLQASAAAAAALLLMPPAVAGGLLNLAPYPLFLGGNVKPNVLVILDNSESMDGTMAGKLIAGNDPATRSNIARGIVQNVIATYSAQFNFGLGTFATGGDGATVPGGTLYNTFAYYFGDAATMIFTNDSGCASAGVSTVNAMRCLPNPQPSNGYAYVTYAASGDDPSINDVLYYQGNFATLWGVGDPGTTASPSTSYETYLNRTTSSATSWTAGDFSTAGCGICGDWGFTPTDAGFLPANPPYPRQLWTPRAWGFLNYPTGAAVIWEPVQTSTSAHLARINALLASETSAAAGGEIKDASVFTPLAGSLKTAASYFSGASTPVGYACQKNFVLLATDGNPTADRNGNMYPPSQMVIQFDPSTDTDTYNFTGQAATDVLAQATALNTLGISGSTFGSNSNGVQTYVVGMGDTVKNPGSITMLNKIAAAGGTGAAYLGDTAAGLTAQFSLIATDIVDRTAAASSVALNAGYFSSGDFLYQAKFTSSVWTGNLLAYAITSAGVIATTPAWDSGLVLQGQDWSSGRTILTLKPSAAQGAQGIPFVWPANPLAPSATELDPAQISALNTGATGSADGLGRYRLPYLRGQRTYETTPMPGTTTTLRGRVQVLGDIIDSAPNYVAAPAFGYSDSMEPAPYSTFAANEASRAPTIYVGANDGMFHGFSAASGKEVLAYVPNAVYPGLSQLSAPAYAHQYYVDGSPTVGDVFFHSGTTGQWHTIAVSGLRAGGQAVFALDVTDPANFTQANAANVVLWEFSDANDADLGYTFGQPLIVKTNDGRWSVIFGNGYNSTQSDAHTGTSGDAYLMVVDAQTGVLKAKIATKSGTVASPNGLSGGIAVDVDGNGTADVVYAGDLNGNLWKFNLAAATPASWAVAYGNATTPAPLFSDPNAQPITTRPAVTTFPQGGYLVLFGTGRFIDLSDASTTTQQTFFGIRDNGVPVSGWTSLVQQKVIGTTTGADGNTYRVTTHAVGPATLDAAEPGDNALSAASYASGKSGWYMLLPDKSSGERDSADPTIFNNSIIFVTMEPNTNPCSGGGIGWTMVLDLTTGNRQDAVTFDTNGSGTITNADLVNYGGSSANGSGKESTSVLSQPTIQLNSGNCTKNCTDTKYSNTSSGTVSATTENAGNQNNHRVSWEQLQ